MLTVDNSILLVVDVQGKLVSLMPNQEELLKGIKDMVKGAQILKIPILWTEQAPQKISKTVFEIARLFKNQKPIEKISFSCFAEKKFVRALESLKRTQIIITGIETDVCVYQTARDLLKSGYGVCVVVDAVSSRKEEDKKIALEHIKTLGGALMTSTMILCELLGKAEGPQFKEILKLMKQN